MSDEGVAPGRPGFRLAFDRRIRPFLLAQLLATTGQRILEIVIAITIFAATRSTLVVGVATAAQVLPQVIFGPLSGAIADRHGLVRHAIYGRILAGVGAVALAAGLWTVPAASVWYPTLIIVGAFVIGVGLTWSSPGALALLPMIARPHELPTIVSLNALMPTIARTVGPAIGVAVLAATDPGMTVLVVALTSFAFIGLILMVPAVPPVDRSPAPEGQESIWRFARSTTGVKAAVILVCSLAFTTDVPATLGPALADLRGDASYVGVFASSFGVGALVSFFLLPMLVARFGSRQLMWVSLGISALGTAAAAAPTPLPMIAGAFAVGGFGNALAMTASTTSLHEAAPNRLRGRVVAIFMTAMMSGRVLAAGTLGVIADLAGAPAALVAAGLVALATTAYLFAVRSRP